MPESVIVHNPLPLQAQQKWSRAVREAVFSDADFKQHLRNQKGLIQVIGSIPTTHVETYFDALTTPTSEEIQVDNGTTYTCLPFPEYIAWLSVYRENGHVGFLNEIFIKPLCTTLNISLTVKMVDQGGVTINVATYDPNNSSNAVTVYFSRAHYYCTLDEDASASHADESSRFDANMHQEASSQTISNGDCLIAAVLGELAKQEKLEDVLNSVLPEKMMDELRLFVESRKGVDIDALMNLCVDLAMKNSSHDNQHSAAPTAAVDDHSEQDDPITTAIRQLKAVVQQRTNIPSPAPPLANSSAQSSERINMLELPPPPTDQNRGNSSAVREQNTDGTHDAQEVPPQAQPISNAPPSTRGLENYLQTRGNERDACSVYEDRHKNTIFGYYTYADKKAAVDWLKIAITPGQSKSSSLTPRMKGALRNGRLGKVVEAVAKVYLEKKGLTRRCFQTRVDVMLSHLSSPQNQQADTASLRQ